MQSLSQYYTSTLPDEQSLVDLTHGDRPGVAFDFKATLLHDDLTAFHLGSAGPNPSDDTDITPWVLKATGTRNTASDIVTTMQLEFDAAILAQINTLKVYVQFWREYWDLTTLDSNGNPALLLSAPVAIVGFQIPDRTFDDAGETVQVQGYEPTWRIRDLYLQNPFTPPAGMLYTDLIAAICEMDELCPSEGGRQPSGTAWSGSPQGQFGTTPYCSVGVTAASVCTQTASDGSLIDPNGLFHYNPDAAILVDSSTHVPIDPWTCHPMTVIYSEQDTCQASNGLYFNTRTGAFYQNSYPQGFATAPFDPFTMQPLPAGLQYEMPNPSTPAQTQGNTPCPLKTWPYDYTGAGPYYGTNGSAQTTSGGGTSSSTTIGPTSLAAGAAATIASRYGQSATITVITAGNYTIQPALCSNDPQLAGYSWCQPIGGLPYDSDTAGVTGYSWPAGNWTVSLTLRGGPVPAGTAAISAALYLKNPDGSQSYLGTTAAGTAVSFAAGSSQLTLSCSLPVAAIAAASGAVIAADVTLACQTDLTATIGATLQQAAFSVSDITIGFPAPQVTTTTTSGPTTAGGNTTTTPTWSGTGIPWPDTNNPGLCPSGCETPGPNIPSARLNITASSLTVPAAINWDRNQNLLALLAAICDAINYTRPWSEERGGVVQFAPKPLFSQATPSPVWTFTTEANRVIAPGMVQKLSDQTAFRNKVIVLSQNNQKEPLAALAKNESAASVISYPNLGRAVMGPPVQDDKIPDQTTCDNRATLELQKDASAMDAVTFQAVHVPFLQPYDPIDVTFVNQAGTTEIDGSTYPYFITAIAFDLFDYTATKYTCGRVVAV